jgi:hypothetical protein
VNERVGIWSWQDAIRQAAVPTGTKALCWALSLYMSAVGRGAWPTVETLMSDTGMKRRAIAGHLKRARKAGLLVATRERRLDGTLGYYTYRPRFPDTVELSPDPAWCGVELSPRADSARGCHNGKHHAQNLRRKRTIQEKKGTRERLPLPHSRGGGTHAAVVEPIDRGNPLNAWGAGE